MFMKPITINTDDILLLMSLYEKEIIVLSMYIKKSNNTKVSRTSHTQYVPHIGLPHKEPLISVSNVNIVPVTNPERVIRCASGFLFMRYNIAEMVINIYTDIDIQAEGK